MSQVQYGGQTLSSEQLAHYRESARKVLGKGYNLFAEMALRVIASHESLALELTMLRRTRTEGEFELDFLYRENEDLRLRVNQLDQERRQLKAQVKQYQHEINVLKRGKIDLPPSWE
ncbi:MAG: hypothetical protein K8L99_00385 [Anaerolineae bacterium]|nr:hypothetical protein [Anaerolineae bacterium]